MLDAFGDPLNIWQDVRADWPTGCLTFKVTRDGANKGLMVTRTPTAAQCNAKRGAHMAAKLADVQRKEEQRA
jgi:hypothetical protein